MRSRHVVQPKAAEKVYGTSGEAPTKVPRPLETATWEWNLETKEYSWSKAMYQIFNLSSPPSRLRSGTFLNRIHPEDRLGVVKALGNALTGAQPYNIDHRILQADGSVRLVHGEAKVWFDRNGRPIRMVGTLQLVNPQR